MEAEFVPSADPLLAALDELDRFLAEQSVQPLHQLGESTVLHWIRVVEGKEGIHLRFPEGDGAESEFYHGMEPDPARQLEPVPAEESPTGFAAALESRLRILHDRIAAYFDRRGYRSSAEQCDQLMVALAGVSRFLSAWCLRHRREPAPVGSGEPYPPDGDDHPYWQHHLWEPYLNDGLVAWEQNSLQPFEAALERLRGLLRRPAAERRPYFFGAGYPLRSRRRPRIKVTVYTPKPRPLLGNSFFALRLQQLRQRLLAAASLPQGLREALLADVRHFIAMTRENCYMLASEPGFLAAPRPGLPVVRGSPAVHPFLLDAMDFFKKAILFHNGTYTRAGGGLDTMFLQVRQLERYYRFHRGVEARRLRTLIDDCVIAWEENRWVGFTAGLVRIANQLRGKALEGP